MMINYNREVRYWKQNPNLTREHLISQLGESTFAIDQLIKEEEQFPDQELEAPERFDSRMEEISFHETIRLIVKIRLSAKQYKNVS